jgi:hypothetical protein
MKIFGWLWGHTPKAAANPNPEPSITALQAADIASMQESMAAVAKLINYDIEGAEMDLK